MFVIANVAVVLQVRIPRRLSRAIEFDWIFNAMWNNDFI